jgi:HEAT repeat protein
MSSAEDDSRTIDQLFDAALDLRDDEKSWGAVAALHWNGSRDVFDRAAVLCRSRKATERTLGADILGQLGIPERRFPVESFKALLELLSDEDANVLNSAIIALYHTDQERAAAHVIPFSKHRDAKVRFAVTYALAGVKSEAALNALLGLAGDPDDDVRNWATFGLGQQSDVDTPRIRETLAARLDDHDEDVRYEAVIGLARRGDARMIGYLKNMLHEDPGDVFAREAAARMLNMDCSGDTTTAHLLGALQRRQRWARRR